MQRLCARCHYAVTFEDDSSLVFCGTCGAPQVRLSEELRSRGEETAAARQASAIVSSLSAAEALPGSTPAWPLAIRLAGLAGLVSAALALLSFPIPPLIGLSFLWAIAAPVVALGVYAGRTAGTRIDGSFGARLGLLCGLAVLLATGLLNTVGLLLARFAFHTGGALDGQLDAMFSTMAANLRTQAAASGNASDIAGFLHLLTVPEFRVGFLLASLAFGAFVYLLFSAAGGAFAGGMRRRAQTARSSR